MSVYEYIDQNLTDNTHREVIQKYLIIIYFI